MKVASLLPSLFKKKLKKKKLTLFDELCVFVQNQSVKLVRFIKDTTSIYNLQTCFVWVTCVHAECTETVRRVELMQCIPMADAVCGWRGGLQAGWLARCSTTATVGRPFRWRLAVQIDRPVRPRKRDMILIPRPDQSRHVRAAAAIIRATYKAKEENLYMYAHLSRKSRQKSKKRN